MKAITSELSGDRLSPIGLPGPGKSTSIHRISSSIQSFRNWVRSNEPAWEYYRLGISATGIFVQVTFAGAMILILGAAGASPFCYTFGIFFAFLADSVAFAQAPMRWVLATFVASIVVNFSLTVYYGIQLLS